MKDAEIRSICKEKVESLEHWLRRLIDNTLTPVYGDYFSFTDANGARLLSGKLCQQVNDRRAKEPMRYPRKIDAVLLDDAIAIICKPDLFSKHFRDALLTAFPEGRDEARTFLSRLSAPRNNLAHANAISHRQAEQIICYSNDIIESLKKYYTDMGLQQEYNVPTIIKITDSFGNVFTRSQAVEGIFMGGGLLINLAKRPEFTLRPGDTLCLEIEVDPSFDPDTYEIRWDITIFKPSVFGPRLVLPITEEQVSQSFALRCYITSKKTWHRLGQIDDALMITYKVLPPVE